MCYMGNDNELWKYERCQVFDYKVTVLLNKLCSVSMAYSQKIHIATHVPNIIPFFIRIKKFSCMCVNKM